MQISTQPPIDLTYCLNVHPGETWEQQLEAIRENTLAIRDRVTTSRATRRFGLGLRLSALSAQQLLGKRGLAPFAGQKRNQTLPPKPAKGACPLLPGSPLPAETEKKGTGTFSTKTSQSPFSLEAFKEFLAEQDLYVFTVNGFPYGQFHQTIVKDRVYKPDWTQPPRRKYTETIARVLAELIDEGATAGISTAPLTFKGWADWQQSIMPGLDQLVETTYTLHQLHQQTGRRVVLALEPEPYCYPETTHEVLRVFDLLRHNIGPRILKRHGIAPSDAAEILQNHLGICFDTAHQAVEFEDLTASLQSLLDAQVPIAKVQLSAALEVDPAVTSSESLSRFADRTYLHQTYVQLPDGTIHRHPDLPGKGDWLLLPERPEGCAAQKVPVPFSDQPIEKKGSDTFCRIHYHWPLYQPAAQPGITSTSHLLLGDFARLLRTGNCPHWEIETYTWNVLPTDQPLDLRTGIAQEFEWVLENLLD